MALDKPQWPAVPTDRTALQGTGLEQEKENRTTTEEVSEHCSHLIGNGHLQFLQQLAVDMVGFQLVAGIDSQMETSCQISFEFVDQEQLNDSVCYLKKALLLMQDTMDVTMRFKDNTPNANVIVQLQELSLRLKSCFTKDYEEQDRACVRTFHETPLQLLEKIKNIFNETKNLLKKDWNVFSKNCNNIFAKCSSQDMVTKPDCNCLYPKATPSSDLTSVAPQQPLTPSIAPMAGLTWADSEGTESSSLLPSEQPLHTMEQGRAKQRPPRSTCQSFESPETPGIEGSPTGDSPQPHPPIGAPITGMEEILDSVLGTNLVLEEASGEAGRQKAGSLRIHSWGNMLPLEELEGKRSTRDRRSITEYRRGHASEGVARPPARSNSVPLTDAGHERQRKGPSDHQLPSFVYHLLVPSVILILLAVGGLLFYRWRRRSRRELQIVASPMEQPEGSPLTQDEDRQVELPV
ncbi:macrophage colony-stimulating factor 1 isoform b precursor [Camelus ferus]|nr:macrophage colony-stimulating factor 1 isoform b precursor [Camelus ferus]